MECEFCEIDGRGQHAPRCPVALEARIAAAPPYIDALQRYSDAWYTLALDHGMKASVAAGHAKHVQDAINGLRSVLSESERPNG